MIVKVDRDSLSNHDKIVDDLRINANADEFDGMTDQEMFDMIQKIVDRLDGKDLDFVELAQKIDLVHDDRFVGLQSIQYAYLDGVGTCHIRTPSFIILIDFVPCTLFVMVCKDHFYITNEGGCVSHDREIFSSKS